MFAPAEPPQRERLADRRLRLWLLTRAVEDSDAVVAPTDECRAGLRRWLALEAPVLEPHDTDAHERLYRGLLQDRTQLEAPLESPADGRGTGHSRRRLLEHP